MNQAQLQGVIRWVLNTIVWPVLLTHGMTQEHWNSVLPYLEVIGGAIIPLITLIWNWYAHSPSWLASHLKTSQQPVIGS